MRHSRGGRFLKSFLKYLKSFKGLICSSQNINYKLLPPKQIQYFIFPFKRPQPVSRKTEILQIIQNTEKNCWNLILHCISWYIFRFDKLRYFVRLQSTGNLRWSIFFVDDVYKFCLISKTKLLTFERKLICQWFFSFGFKGKISLEMNFRESTNLPTFHRQYLLIKNRFFMNR